MTSIPIHNILLNFLPCLIPPYALRLTRVFGTRRIGWVLFTVFSLLAGLQLLRAWQPFVLGLDPEVTLDLLDFLVPVLLLISMVHIEMVFKERLRLEQEERRLRAGLELEVKERTTELDKANEELQSEISLRKQGEQELKKSKEQYRFLFEENPQPMWIYDRETLGFLALNTAALRHYGFTRDEFRDLKVTDLCPPGEPDAFTSKAPEKAWGVQRRGLWRHLKKDGTLMDVEVTELDLFYSGVPARLVLVNDVTAQRLLQKEMLQSQKMAVTTQLAGGIADRFSSLLGVMEADAQGLIQKSPDPAAAGPLRRIAATASTAGDLTRQLLALIRRHPMQPQMLSLSKLIEHQAPILARLVGKKIALETRCPPNLPSVMADPALVSQVLHHLVSNARDAMAEGGTVSVAAEMRQVDAPQARLHDEARQGTFIALSVTDTGCGMTPEIQARLFEPFFTTKDARKATGLGLATVRGLVKQHAGWVEVVSAPNAGTRITVFFPRGPTPALSSGNRAAGYLDLSADLATSTA
jgi:two-component system, cell cycle sensor histidine kinase and response regulator CckA